MAYEDAKTNEVAYMNEVRRIFGDYKLITFDRLEIKPGQRVLDVGCGPGRDVQALAERTVELTRFGGRIFTEINKPENNHAKITQAVPAGIS